MKAEDVLPFMVIRVLPSSRHWELRGRIGTVMKVTGPGPRLMIAFHDWKGGHNGNGTMTRKDCWFLSGADIKDIEVVTDESL